LQAVARAKSFNQPDRLLVINIQGARSCQELYKAIKLRVFGPVEDFEFSPEEVAEVISYALCGPIGHSDKENKKLPMTSNDCRIKVDAQSVARKKKTNFPILVIDEFNPNDFTWPKDADYGIKELEENIGDAFKIFNALKGLAHTGGGFVAFLGTKSEAFARALHKINRGSKAALARCTTRKPTKTSDGSYAFDDWQGIQWSPEDKAKLVLALYGEKFKEALHKNGISDDEAEIQAENLIQDLCLDVGKTIRNCCLEMAEALNAEEEDFAAILQDRTQDSLISAGCSGDWKELFKTSTESCTIM
jgi:hypothetical protein